MAAKTDKQAHRELDSVGVPRTSSPSGTELPLWYRVAMLRTRMEEAEARLEIIRGVIPIGPLAAARGETPDGTSQAAEA